MLLSDCGVPVRGFQSRGWAVGGGGRGVYV